MIWIRYILVWLYPLTYAGRGLYGVRYTHPASLDFCLLLKKSLGNPYLEILEHLKLFVESAPTKKTGSK